jgi:hypothetical protein
MPQVDIEKFQQVVDDAGLKMEPMSAFYKIETGGRRMYVTRTKRVSRVDISGFRFTHPAVKVLVDDDRREKRMGRVEAQIDFTKKEEQILEAFQTGLAFMQALGGDDEVDLPPKLRKEVEQQLANPSPARRPRAQAAQGGQLGGQQGGQQGRANNNQRGAPPEEAGAHS